MIVLDGDGHMVEPLEVWTRYVDPKCRDRIRVTYDRDGWMGKVFIGDLLIRDATAPRSWGMGDALYPGGLKEGKVKYRHFEEAHPGGFHGKDRLAVHDAEDIVAAVIFPSVGMYLSSVTDRQLAVASARAINDWAGQAYAAVAPEELLMVASLPSHFPEESAAELRRTVKEYGFVAGTVRPTPFLDGRLLSDPGYEVLWSAAEELGVPVCIHNSNLDYGVKQAGADRTRTWGIRHAIVHPMEGMLALSSLYEAGVFERHPQLRIGFMEASCGWAPFWVERLHEDCEGLAHLTGLRHKRSVEEVFTTQCVVGCEGDERMAPIVQQLLGLQSVVWASDFPHFDTEPPFSRDMRERNDMTPEQKAACLYRASADFYRLDLDSILQANAARRGIAVPVAA